MISLSGLVLGIINILIVVVVLLLIGAIIELIMRYIGWTVDWTVRRLYLAFVALVAHLFACPAFARRADASFRRMTL